MKTYKSGNIKHRKRKIPIIWDGEHAQHIAEEYINDKRSHPLLHIKIQQLAKKSNNWKQSKKGSKRHESIVVDNETNRKFLIVVEIWRNFAFIITCYKR